MLENEPEFYPMPFFVQLIVHDLGASSRWYQDALGFRSVYAMPGPDGALRMVHLRLGRYQDLMLMPDPPDTSLPSAQRGKGVNICLSIEGGIDALAARAKAAGAQVVAGPVDRPWNVRELTVQDPDGYRLTFSQVIDATRDFGDVMSGVDLNQ